jgi:hypothetical protein
MLLILLTVFRRLLGPEHCPQKSQAGQNRRDRNGEILAMKAFLTGLAT